MGCATGQVATREALGWPFAVCAKIPTPAISIRTCHAHRYAPCATTCRRSAGGADGFCRGVACRAAMRIPLRRDENSTAPQSPLHHYPKKSIRHNCLPTNTHPPQPRAYITTPLLLLPPINWRYGRFLSRRGVPRRDENSAALRLGGNVLRLEFLCPAIGTLRLAIRNPSLPLALAYSISSQKRGGFRLPHHSDTFAAYFCESFSISSFAFFLPIS